jgi:hypothetical protein
MASKNSIACGSVSRPRSPLVGKCHQRVHGGGQPLLRHLARRVRRGEAEPRQARDDHVEVGQQVGEVELQRKRVGPAVHHQECRSVRRLGAQVHEVQVDVVDRGDELRVAVEPRLSHPPVPADPPVDELTKVRGGHARCRTPGRVLRDPAAGKSLAQIREDLVRDVDREGPWLAHDDDVMPSL